MALSVPCPTCGPRPVEEFLYGEIRQTPDSITDPDSRDLDRVFMRSNSDGPSREAWFHAYGCRRWVTLVRDRTTDKWVEGETG